MTRRECEVCNGPLGVQHCVEHLAEMEPAELLARLDGWEPPARESPRLDPPVDPERWASGLSLGEQHIAALGLASLAEEAARYLRALPLARRADVAPLRAARLDEIAAGWIEVARAIAAGLCGAAARVALRPDGQFSWILEVERFGRTVEYRAEEVLGVFAVERAGAGVVGECVGLGRAIELVLADAAEVP